MNIFAGSQNAFKGQGSLLHCLTFKKCVKSPPTYQLNLLTFPKRKCFHLFLQVLSGQTGEPMSWVTAGSSINQRTVHVAVPVVSVLGVHVDLGAHLRRDVIQGSEDLVVVQARLLKRKSRTV